MISQCRFKDPDSVFIAIQHSTKKNERIAWWWANYNCHLNLFNRWHQPILSPGVLTLEWYPCIICRASPCSGPWPHSLRLTFSSGSPMIRWVSEIDVSLQVRRGSRYYPFRSWEAGGFGEVMTVCWSITGSSGMSIIGGPSIVPTDEPLCLSIMQMSWRVCFLHRLSDWQIGIFSVFDGSTSVWESRFLSWKDPDHRKVKKAGWSVQKQRIGQHLRTFSRNPWAPCPDITRSFKIKPDSYPTWAYWTLSYVRVQKQWDIGCQHT